MTVSHDSSHDAHMTVSHDAHLIDHMTCHMIYHVTIVVNVL
jgi:hypothetical protein